MATAKARERAAAQATITDQRGYAFGTSIDNLLESCQDMEPSTMTHLNTDASERTKIADELLGPAGTSRFSVAPSSAADTSRFQTLGQNIDSAAIKASERIKVESLFSEGGARKRVQNAADDCGCGGSPRGGAGPGGGRPGTGTGHAGHGARGGLAHGDQMLNPFADFLCTADADALFRTKIALEDGVQLRGRRELKALSWDMQIDKNQRSADWLYDARMFYTESGHALRVRALTRKNNTRRTHGS